MTLKMFITDTSSTHRLNTEGWIGSTRQARLFGLAKSFADFVRLLEHHGFSKPRKDYTSESHNKEHLEFAQNHVGCVCYASMSGSEILRVYGIGNPYEFNGSEPKECAYTPSGEGVTFEIMLNKPRKELLDPKSYWVGENVKDKISLGKPIKKSDRDPYETTYRYVLDDWMIDFLKGRTIEKRGGSFDSEMVTIKYPEDMSKTLSASTIQHLVKMIEEVYSSINYIRKINALNFTKTIMYRFRTSTDMDKKSGHNGAEIGTEISSVFEWGVFDVSSCGSYIKKHNNGKYLNEHGRDNVFFGKGENPFKRIECTDENLAKFIEIETLMLKLSSMFTELNEMDTKKLIQGFNPQLLLN